MRSLHTTTANQGDRDDAASLAVHIIRMLQGAMILAVTLKRPELMADAAERLRTCVE